MNRKQKAMEERGLPKAPKFKPKVNAIDSRPLTNLEDVQEYLIAYKRWYNQDEIKKHISKQYKNGAELFDLAMKIEQSPLMKALS